MVFLSSGRSRCASLNDFVTSSMSTTEQRWPKSPPSSALQVSESTRSQSCGSAAHKLMFLEPYSLARQIQPLPIRPPQHRSRFIRRRSDADAGKEAAFASRRGLA